ncbi:MAG: SAM-dependent chlorinase/fluorinase [Bacteroidota bacterium]
MDLRKARSPINMAIITLTSDLGDSSHYPAVIKGVILSLFPAANIIDVTHNVNSFDIMQAAYVVKHTLNAFPPDSIHIIAIDPEKTDTQTGLVVRYQDQWLVGPDNGVMSLICEGQETQCVTIENEGLLRQNFPRSFRAAWAFAPTAAFLASGGTAEEIGPTTAMRDLRWGEPSYTDNCLRGKIIHIDKFGNAITNIDKPGFLSLKQDRRFEIFIRNVRLRRIVTTYSDVAKADALAIFGESSMLEIAMREASAAELLGLKVHDMITIEFS